MSTTSEPANPETTSTWVREPESSFDRSESAGRIGLRIGIKSGDASTAADPGTVQDPGMRVLKRSATTKSQPKVKRRLQGFFVQAEGQEARVALVDQGTLVHYYLPLSLLHEAGVKLENQPFELDELEAELGGVVLTGHRIKALASPEEFEIVPLALDPEQQQKLSRILRR